MIRFVIGLFAVMLAVPRVFAEKSEPSCTVRLVRVLHHGLQPQAVVDGRGVIHLIYFAGDPKEGDLFYARSSDNGNTFSEPVQVNSQAGSAIAMGTIRGGQIALGKNNRVHVAWNGSGAARPEGPINPEAGKPGSPILYARMDDCGRAFEPQKNLMQHTFGLDGGGSIAADHDGNVYVAWHGKGANAAKGEAGRQMWIARSTDDGKTFAAEKPAWNRATGACGCCGTGLFATQNGTLFALYRSATEDVHRDIYLLASSDRGRTFTGELLDKWEINACPMSSMGFVESAGSTFGAWESGGQVYFSKLAVNGRASEPTPAPGNAKNRKHPRLAASNTDTLLVWTEGTGWQRGGSLAWQVFDKYGKTTATSGRQDGIPAWSFAAPVLGRDGAFLIFY